MKIKRRTTIYSSPPSSIYSFRLLAFDRFPSLFGLAGTSPAMRNHIRKAALQAGISKRIHWHGFRYELAWLIANGEDIKVAQELLRHASPHTTLQFYAVASEQKKRDAQERIEDMIFPQDQEEPFIPFSEPPPPAEVPAYASAHEKRHALEWIESMMLTGRRFLDSESIRSDIYNDIASKDTADD